ncbi:MAG: PadR family transcriptional regulator [Lachnospiraceae bacterium]|nr:PadR family transcriptional regulator [Lachnospiraceae bacterium]
MDRQLRKGLLEFCVLAAIKDEDSYGYKMIEDISPYIDISESTLYPILRRLEVAGKVVSYNTEYNNRIRKYFHITEEGKSSLKEFDKDREELVRVLEFISGGKMHE